MRASAKGNDYRMGTAEQNFTLHISRLGVQIGVLEYEFNSVERGIVMQVDGAIISMGEISFTI